MTKSFINSKTFRILRWLPVAALSIGIYIESGFFTALAFVGIMLGVEEIRLQQATFEEMRKAADYEHDTVRWNCKFQDCTYSIDVTKGSLSFAIDEHIAKCHV